MNMHISGRIRPVPRHDNGDTRAVRSHLTGRIPTKDCECSAGFYFNSISVFFGRSLGNFLTLKLNTACVFTAEKWFYLTLRNFLNFFFFF